MQRGVVDCVIDHGAGLSQKSASAAQDELLSCRIQTATRVACARTGTDVANDARDAGPDREGGASNKLVTGHWSLVTSHQSPVTSHQSPVTSHRAVDGGYDYTGTLGTSRGFEVTRQTAVELAREDVFIRRTLASVVCWPYANLRLG
jgi:hypothetical protein